MAQTITPEFTAGLVSASRTALGDTLRCVVYFSPDDHEELYLRSDLRGTETAREAKTDLVANERLGFDSGETYRDLAERPGLEPALGEYLFTLRAFTEGYLARVIVGDRGVLVTTDAMDIDAFEEFAVAARGVLASD